MELRDAISRRLRAAGDPDPDGTAQQLVPLIEVGLVEEALRNPGFIQEFKSTLAAIAVIAETFDLEKLKTLLLAAGFETRQHGEGGVEFWRFDAGAELDQIVIRHPPGSLHPDYPIEVYRAQVLAAHYLGKHYGEVVGLTAGGKSEPAQSKEGAENG